jgi:hypothetical protein
MEEEQTTAIIYELLLKKLKKMYTVENSNGQLKLTYSNLVEYYEFPTFKSISSGFDTVRGNYYVIINFIANDKNNSLRLYLVDITNQADWTDTADGSKRAVDEISSWISSSIIPSLSGVSRSAFTKRVTGSTDQVIVKTYSISVASVGTANATVSSDGGSTFSVLKPGETVSYEAGGASNYFDANTFVIVTTTVGAEALIIYTY